MPKVTPKKPLPKPPGIYDMDRWAAYDQTDAIRDAAMASEDVKGGMELLREELAETRATMELLTIAVDNLREALEKRKP